MLLSNNTMEGDDTLINFSFISNKRIEYASKATIV